MVTPTPADLAAKNIIVAVDVSEKPGAVEIVKLLRNEVGWFKFGFEAILALDPSWIAKLGRDYAARVFADVKLNDIPNTVGKATAALAAHGFAAMNVHASTTMDALKAVAENKGEMLAFGVTVLTSFTEEECVSVFGQRPDYKVLDFTQRLLEAGLDGVICSPQEAELIRVHGVFDQMLIWTPGIRPSDSPPDDQARTRTPGEAILFADGLVIGRPILGTPNPVLAARRIAMEMSEANAEVA